MELPDMGDANEHIDKATEHQRETWWKSLSDEEQFAWVALISAAVIGPLGMSVVAATGNLYSGKVPSANQFEAVILLVLLTAPVVFGVGVLVAMARYGAGAFFWAGAAAIVGGWVTSNLGPTTKLGGFYCYRSLETLQHACRAFNEAGFQSDAAAAGGGPTGGARILGFALAYTSDARGSVMAMCGVVAGIAGGYLIHRQVQKA